MTNATDLNGNSLLNLLPRSEARTLLRYLEPRELVQQKVLHEPREPIREVHFVTRGVVSLVKKLDTGEIIEIATVGPEGMVGATLALVPGFRQIPHRPGQGSA